MEAIIFTDEFRRNGKAFAALLTSLSEQEVMFRPAPEKWNLLEIVCHLLDEERLDFRAKMRHIMERPEMEFEPIDPEGWVISHKYSERIFVTVLDDFLNERKISLEWLKTLTEEDLEKKMEHKVFGTVTVKHFLSNWLAHDYLHIRQIIGLKHSYLKTLTSTDLRYAGDW